MEICVSTHRRAQASLLFAIAAMVFFTTPAVRADEVVAHAAASTLPPTAVHRLQALKQQMIAAGQLRTTAVLETRPDGSRSYKPDFQTMRVVTVKKLADGALALNCVDENEVRAVGPENSR